MSKKEVFPQEVKEKIDQWIERYPSGRKQSAVIPGLHILQEYNNGYLTTELMNSLALYLEMSEVAVYEVATFYSMYNLSPVGKHQINVCNNISCKLRGADEIVEYLSKKLNIKPGETTEDGKYTLRTVECQGACCGAPMLEVNKVFHEYLTPSSVDKILEKLES